MAVMVCNDKFVVWNYLSASIAIVSGYTGSS